MGRIEPNVSAVTVSAPVDGTAPRATRGPGRRPNTSAVERQRVDPVLMEAARRAMRPGQRIVVESATVVRLVNA